MRWGKAGCDAIVIAFHMEVLDIMKGKIMYKEEEERLQHGGSIQTLI